MKQRLLAWLGHLFFALVYVQEILLHSLGLPHFEARNFDPLTIKHMCDGVCHALASRLRRAT